MQNDAQPTCEESVKHVIGLQLRGVRRRSHNYYYYTEKKMSQDQTRSVPSSRNAAAVWRTEDCITTVKYSRHSSSRSLPQHLEAAIVLLLSANQLFIYRLLRGMRLSPANTIQPPRLLGPNEHQASKQAHEAGDQGPDGLVPGKLDVDTGSLCARPTSKSVQRCRSGTRTDDKSGQHDVAQER